MKPIRTVVIALLSYAAVLAPSASQARSVELSLPGISVRVPAPPFPILLPPGVVITGGDRHHDHGPVYRQPPPRFYHNNWHRQDSRHDRWERRHDRRDDRHDRRDDRRDDRHDRRDDHRSQRR
jgi:hypothetical protein